MVSLSPEGIRVPATVRRLVDDEVRPVARELEHADEYPGALIDAMREPGVLGGGTHGSRRDVLPRRLVGCGGPAWT